jgi:hypothetical protein
VFRSSKLFLRPSTNSTQPIHLECRSHYHPDLESKSAKIVSQNLLETVRGRLPHSTPPHRKVGYIRNAVFGTLYSAANYNQ